MSATAYVKAKLNVEGQVCISTFMEIIKDFIDLRNGFSDEFNKNISNWNSQWDLIHPDINLFEDEDLWLEYTDFIYDKVRPILDEINEGLTDKPYYADIERETCDFILRDRKHNGYVYLSIKKC